MTSESYLAEEQTSNKKVKRDVIDIEESDILVPSHTGEDSIFSKTPFSDFQLNVLNPSTGIVTAFYLSRQVIHGIIFFCCLLCCIFYILLL